MSPAPKPKLVPPTTASPRAAIQALRLELRARFYERGEVVDGVLAAVLAKQHVFLGGPPGTGKSNLCDALFDAIDGAQKFSWLLSKFTTPEELFGPVSLMALQQDRVARITTGKLPEAHFINLDECFKASSAILNALLKITNERVFFNDGKAVQSPLMTLVGASNETPEDSSLAALYDRLLVRFWVGKMREQGNIRALWTGKRPPAQARISLSEIEAAITEAAAVAIPDSVLDTMLRIKQSVEEKGYNPSDRRWYQLIGIVRAYTYLDGCDVARDDHLEILQHCLWDDPKDRATVALTVSEIASPVTVKTNSLIDRARNKIDEIKPPTDMTDPTQRANWVKEMTLADSALDDMLKEAVDLRAAYPIHLSRIDACVATLQGIKKDALDLLARAYKI